MKQADTKEIIIEKVFKLLLKNGYDRVSISNIQEETGMARGLLYHYFGSKEQLFIDATTRYFLEMFNIDLDKIKDYNVEQLISYTTERYKDILDKSFIKFASEGSISIVDYDFLFYRVNKENPTFALKYDSFREHELVAWQMVLENEIKAGNIKKDIDIRKTATYFTFLLDGVWMRMVSKNSTDILLTTLGDTLLDYYNLLKK